MWPACEMDNMVSLGPQRTSCGSRNPPIEQETPCASCYQPRRLKRVQPQHRGDLGKPQVARDGRDIAVWRAVARHRGETGQISKTDVSGGNGALCRGRGAHPPQGGAVAPWSVTRLAGWWAESYES